MGRAPCCDKANVKRGPWSPEEDSKLKSYIDLHGTGGNWIALPQKIGLKRCGKSCRLRWLNYLRPNIKHGAFSEEEDNLICSLYISIGSRWSIIASQLPGRTDNDIKNYWNTRLKKKLLGKQRKEHQAILARRSLKQQEIIKRGLVTSNGDIGNSTVNVPMALLDHQNPYWPELQGIQQLPMTHEYSSSSSSNQEVGVPSFNDHASIRKLLIKLGGRFDSNHHRDNVVVQPKTQDVYHLPSSTQPIYQEDFAQMSHYNNNHIGEAMNMFHGGQSGHCSLSNELKDMVYNIDPRNLDGLEFLYSDEQGFNGWNGHEELQLVYPPPSLVASGSDYDEGMHRLLTPQEQCVNFCGTSSYPGIQ